MTAQRHRRNAPGPQTAVPGDGLEPSDEQLIEAVLDGDVEMYAQLVQRHQRAACQLAYSFVGNFEDAKELSQNAFVKAYQHLDRFQRRSKFSTWLYRIIANECKDFFRWKGRRPRYVSLSATPESEESIMFDVEDPSGDPSDAMAQRELARQLQTGIHGLTDQQRAAFVLHHVNGLPIDEVSGMMRCRPGTVKAHLFRACAQLRVRLARYLTQETR